MKLTKERTLQITGTNVYSEIKIENENKTKKMKSCIDSLCRKFPIKPPKKKTNERILEMSSFAIVIHKILGKMLFDKILEK